MATGTLVDVVMPQMGVSVSEGTITKWLKHEGEPIEADETLLEISTDKVDTEVPSPATGVVQQILVQEGETVDGRDDARGDRARGGARLPPPREAPGAEELPEPAAQEATAESPPLGRRGEPAAAAPPAPGPGGRRPPRRPRTARRFVSPVVARIAAEHGVDVGPGSGHRPRRPRDEEGHPRASSSAGAGTAPAARAAGAPTAPSAGARPRPAAPAALRTAPRAQAAAPRPPAGETVEPMTAMRKGIAEHMRRSLDTSAHVTSAIEVDMSKVGRDPASS